MIVALTIPGRSRPCPYLVQTLGCREQSFGNWDLRVHGINPVIRVCEIVGVESWEQLQGKHCRVVRENGLLKGIGHIVKDTWYYPEREYAERADA